MDDVGDLSVWNLKDNCLTHIQFGKIQTSCIAVSTHEDDVIAVGTKNGEICVLDTTGESALSLALNTPISLPDYL